VAVAPISATPRHVFPAVPDVIMIFDFTPSVGNDLFAMVSDRAIHSARHTLRSLAVPRYLQCRPFAATSQLRSGPTEPSISNDPSTNKTHFGYETVTETEKTERVAGVFTSVAESYDRMNDLMSFGWHRIWK
jgi:2-methoxy-6-polyprenyl-1,4-benzoquinol methylase